MAFPAELSAAVVSLICFLGAGAGEGVVRKSLHKVRGLLPQLVEDGAFGAPIFDFPGRPPVSRDLLDSVNELLYLDRKLDIVDRSELRVLDIGAGYGRLAHRMAQLVPGLADYACVDAIPESIARWTRWSVTRGLE